MRIVIGSQEDKLEILPEFEFFKMSLKLLTENFDFTCKECGREHKQVEIVEDKSSPKDAKYSMLFRCGNGCKVLKGLKRC